MIPIQNIFYMLTYAFKVLNKQSYKRIATETFENTGDMFAAILIKGVSIQIKRGLHRDYLNRTEPMSSPRGKMHISDSIKTQSILKKELVCTYDEFSVNSYMNCIIKTTIELLVKSDISTERKKQMRKLLIYFKDVEPLDIQTINWKISFNQNNQSYQMLISICYLVIKGLLQTNSSGTNKLMDFLDDQRMSRLYEQFLLNYYKKHFPEFKVTASQIPWSLDDGMSAMLPIMQSDIQIQKGNDVLIIDAKFYRKTTQTQFDIHKIHSNNLYQIFTYVKNKDYEFGDEPHTVSGLILYAKTDHEIQPNNIFQMHGNQISVKTLDLNVDFTEIKAQLEDILATIFIQYT